MEAKKPVNCQIEPETTDNGVSNRRQFLGTVLSAGTAEGDGQVALSLVNVVRNQVGQQPLDTLQEFFFAVSDTIMKPMHARARKLGWNLHEVKGDHAILVGDPDTTVRLLEKFA